MLVKALGCLQEGDLDKLQSVLHEWDAVYLFSNKLRVTHEQINVDLSEQYNAALERNRELELEAVAREAKYNESITAQGAMLGEAAAGKQAELQGLVGELIKLRAQVRELGGTIS